MLILSLKLIATPLLILSLTMLSRRFGPTVGGLLLSVPLLTGPISVFTALENGYAFAQQAAVTNLVGQVSTCLYCFCYAVSARRSNCWFSTAASVATFFMATFLWSQFNWTLASAVGLLLCTIILMSASLKPVSTDTIVRVAPRFDLPARMIVSTAFVLLITMLTKPLGPHLSGLVAPFPVFSLILCAFTHHQMGAGAVANLVRGIIIGSLSFAAFFIVIASGLTAFGPVFAYGGATLASILVSWLVYLATHYRPQQVLPGSASGV